MSINDRDCIVAIVGDMHVNATTALPPNINKIELDDGGFYEPSNLQKAIWSHWEDYWKRVAELKAETGLPVVGVFNGELGDDLTHRSSQLITKNKSDIVYLGTKALKPALEVVDIPIVLRGTEAHSGSSGWIDEQIADDIGAIGGENGRASRYHITATFGGKIFDIAHHPATGESSRPWLKGHGALRLAHIAHQDYQSIGMQPPDFYIRGHRHVPGDSGDVLRTRAMIAPSWKVGDAYIQKLGSRPAPPIGGLIFVCELGKPATVEKVYKRVVKPKPVDVFELIEQMEEHAPDATMGQRSRIEQLKAMLRGNKS